MEIEYIDVNEVELKFKKALAKFEQRPDVSEENKELVKHFLRESFLGKTNPGRGFAVVGARGSSGCWAGDGMGV